MLDKNAKSVEDVLTPVASDMASVVHKQVATLKATAKQLESLQNILKNPWTTTTTGLRK